MSEHGAAIFEHEISEHQLNPFRRDSTGRIHSRQATAALRAKERGAEVIYVGSSDQLEAIDLDPWLSEAVPPSLRWRTLPVANIAGAARRAMPELLRDPSSYPPVLGAMCLPVGVVDRLLPSRGKPRACLLLDGVGTSDPDSYLAREGIRALCDQTGTEFHAFA